MKQQKFDYILLAGIRLKDDGEAPSEMLLRVNRAYQVWRLNQNASIIACGGDAAGVGVSEAETMKRLLMRLGVPEDRLLIEDKSLITAENLRNARAFMGDNAPCALVTSDYHMGRAKQLSKREGINTVKCFKAKTPFSVYKIKLKLMEILGRLDALCGWQDENKLRPKCVESFKKFISRLLLGR